MKKVVSVCVYLFLWCVFIYIFLNIFLSLPRERERKVYIYHSHLFLFFSRVPTFFTYTDAFSRTLARTRSRFRSSTFVPFAFVRIRSLSSFPRGRLSYLREHLSVARYIIIPAQPFEHTCLFKVSSPRNRTCDVIPHFYYTLRRRLNMRISEKRVQ